MREILFRGKRVYGKEKYKWVYGSLIISEDCMSICSDDIKDDVEVNPETVGQYTGLKDKNGVKIFEGDIVKNINDNLFIVKYGAYFPEQYVNYLCSMYGHEIFGFYFEGTDGIDYVIPENPNVEVVGNIFNNPELPQKIEA